MASEIEGQCVRWIAELLGLPNQTEGLLVSGGNMANFVCFLAARRAKGGDALREKGLGRDHPRLLVYAPAEDERHGDRPFLLVGNAGTVSTGAVDPFPRLAAIAREHDLWLHADGAYGAPAALSEEAPEDLRGLALADSVAVDPHKWLYVAPEAGCALVRHPGALRDAFSYTPPYYRFDGEGTLRRSSPHRATLGSSPAKPPGSAR